MGNFKFIFSLLKGILPDFYGGQAPTRLLGVLMVAI